jgi:hypothetical protein
MDDSGRRQFLAATGAFAGLAGLAGCYRPDSSDVATLSPEGTATGDDGDGGASTPAGGDGESSDLDLREANVVDVSVSEEGDREFRFDVSLHHDDAGEGGYANWWQVETLDGDRLGRRELLHAHSEQPFTRSETVEVPDGVNCVVVRGHDETHGYGGQAMVVTIGSGARRTVDQGPEPASFADATCPSE